MPARRWRRRPMLRNTIVLAAVLAPALASAGVAVVFSRTVPLPTEIVWVLVWLAAFTVAVVATWIVAAELLRRMLPLATLLDLTLAFPDVVPSRFAILRRNVDPRRLEGDLRRLRERADPDSGPRAQLILELAVALSVHDDRTRGHSERVRMYTDLIAHELHLSAADTDRLRWAALLHDIGKLAVDPAILNKPELPDDVERVSLRNHPIEGYRMIAPLQRWLGPWAETVRDHHERFDGTGYPQGLRGREISLGGRIVAVADSYEAMTTGRPYRRALSVAAAREELVRRSGTHFDPDVVRAFLAVSLGRLWPVVGIGALFTGVPFLGPLGPRFSTLSTRAVSGFAAASTTAALVVSGVAGPAAAGIFVHGPAAKTRQVATAANPVPVSQPNVASPAAAPTAAPPTSAPPASTAPSPAAATSAATGSVPNVTTSNPPPPPSGGGGGGAKSPVYPAGIAKHATLPAGIAKNPNAFAQWRLHH